MRKTIRSRSIRAMAPFAFGGKVSFVVKKSSTRFWFTFLELVSIFGIMIKSFADKDSAAIFARERVRGMPSEILVRARKKLVLIASAQSLSFLRLPPSNRLEALHGNRRGFYSIRINDQWRIVFRFVDGNAYDVEICDYH